MDWSLWICVLTLLKTVADCQLGVDLPRPANLTLDMWDGEVTAVWSPPGGGPSRPHYCVEMAKHWDKWKLVSSCERTLMTFCDLTDLIEDPTGCYRVRVRMVTKGATSPWVYKRFCPNQSQLQPPTFTLLASSSSVTVVIHRKPILRKMFLFGMTYTVYLQERGPANRTLVEELRDGVEEEEEGELRFDYLHWGREYCVSVKVEANTVDSVSKASPQKCFLLPEPVWFTMAAVSLSVLTVAGMLGFLVLALCCVLRRPEKTPAALNSTKIGWVPLQVQEEYVEVVQDRGWFLSVPRPEARSWGGRGYPTPDALEKERAQGDRGADKRRSVDRGVSGRSDGKRREEEERGREDSGFGSIGGGAGSGASSRSGTGEPPLRTGGGDCGVSQGEDGEAERGCRPGSSGSPEGEECAPIPRMMHRAADEYRSQSPLSVDLRTNEEILKESPCETQIVLAGVVPGYRPTAHCATETKTVLADVVPGYRPTAHCPTETKTVLAGIITSYRSGHMTCVCSGEGRCVWCQTTGQYRRQEEQQTGALCIPELTGTPGIYLRKTHIQTDTAVNIEDVAMMSFPLQPSIHPGEYFPLLTALTTDRSN